jgi:hypothetical protein
MNIKLYHYYHSKIILLNCKMTRRNSYFVCISVSNSKCRSQPKRTCDLCALEIANSIQKLT